MNWNELKRIAIDYGWRLKKHGKNMTSTTIPKKSIISKSSDIGLTKSKEESVTIY